MSETEATENLLENGSEPMTPDSLFEKLEAMGIQTSTISHEPLFTVDQSSRIKDTLPGGHTKNLFVKDKKGNHFLIVAEAHAEIALNKVHSLIGAKGRVSFGNSDRLMRFLGVRPGSVTAFAPINDHANVVKVVIDEPLMEFDQINCHPLTNEMTTTISKTDLLRFLEEIGHPPDIIRVSGEFD